MYEAASIAVSNAGGHLRNTKVLIVGAGPVGLTLAIDLGQRGVACTLIEKKDRPAFLPKMERANARTMEIYRRMGLSKMIRAAGLSRHIPMDVYVVLDLALRAPRHRAEFFGPSPAIPKPSIDSFRTSEETIVTAVPFRDVDGAVIANRRM
jgi:threonine dehydrogenase-like Zn-dependent dehydrogenase